MQEVTRIHAHASTVTSLLVWRGESDRGRLEVCSGSTDKSLGYFAWEVAEGGAGGDSCLSLVEQSRRPAAHAKWITGLARVKTRDETWLLSTSLDGEIRTWDARILGKDCAPLDVGLIAGGGAITSLEVHPETNIAYVGSRTGVVEAWRLASGGKLTSLGRVFEGAGVQALSVDPAGERLFVATRAGELARADLSAPGLQGERIARLRNRTATTIRWIPGRGLLVGVDHGAISLWVPRGPRWLPTTQWLGHEGGTESLVVLANEADLQFASSGLDGCIRAWALGAKAAQAEFQLVRGHAPVLSMAPRGNRWWVLAGTNAKEILLLSV